MREIKFRGKRYGDGAWVYGSLYQGIKEGEKYSIILNDSGYHLAPPDDRNLAIAFAENEVNVVIPATVGQFTGLYDKNSKEIYEGDIVSTSNYGKDIEIGNQIKNVSGSQLYEVKMLQCNFVLDSKYRSHYLIYYKDYEVIGNIHDNPEMLNKRD